MLLLCLWRRSQRIVVPLAIGFLLILTTRTSSAPTSPLDLRCTLRPVTGACRAALPGVFFDATSGRCKRFTYGGCGGNGFIFYCMEECDLVCVQRKDINDFAEAFESVLAANSSDQSTTPSTTTTTPSHISQARGDRLTHPSRPATYVPIGRYTGIVRREHARSDSLRLLPKPDITAIESGPGGSAIDPYRALQDARPASKYICPLQEAFEGEGLTGFVQDDQPVVTPSTKSNSRYPPRS